MDDRTLKELIYLARSNDPVALQYLYSYYDALVKAVMRKMKYISSMSLEPQDLLQVGLITSIKYSGAIVMTWILHLMYMRKAVLLKKMQSLLKKQYTFFTRYEKKSVSLDKIVNYEDSRTYGELIADQKSGVLSTKGTESRKKIWGTYLCDYPE